MRADLLRFAKTLKRPDFCDQEFSDHSKHIFHSVRASSPILSAFFRCCFNSVHVNQAAP